MTEQTEFWKGSFGNQYTDRNKVDLNSTYMSYFGVTRTDLNKEVLQTIDTTNLTILEAGCNRGLQLKLLREQGFNNLWGIDINLKALNSAKDNKQNNIVEGSILDIPYKDNFFDLVFTSGVLIHIHPSEIKNAIAELYRTTKKYIWCFEYYSDNYENIPYRGYENKMWKANFLQLFIEQYPDLKIIKKRKLNYLENPLKYDMMFLLMK